MHMLDMEEASSSSSQLHVHLILLPKPLPLVFHSSSHPFFAFLFPLQVWNSIIILPIIHLVKMHSTQSLLSIPRCKPSKRTFLLPFSPFEVFYELFNTPVTLQSKVTMYQTRYSNHLDSCTPCPSSIKTAAMVNESSSPSIGFLVCYSVGLHFPLLQLTLSNILVCQYLERLGFCSDTCPRFSNLIKVQLPGH